MLAPLVWAFGVGLHARLFGERLGLQMLHPPAIGREALRLLLQRHIANQSDLPDAQSLVSGILRGKCQFNVRQICRLAAGDMPL